MSPASAPPTIEIEQHVVGENVWLHDRGTNAEQELMSCIPQALSYEVLDSEEAVGQAMFAELREAAARKRGNLAVVILGGRGGQALHRLLGEKAQNGEIDHLLARLDVFTQDALAPMRMDNSFSFVRDFERLLGDAFFAKVNSFTSMPTDAGDLQTGLVNFLAELEGRGPIDLLFLGLGPEAGGASHLAYIKPGSGAQANDLAGLIPISPDILEHHVRKFKVGGAATNDADEAECRRASHILTLGPAAILRARRIVQSIVDAGTAPGKVASFDRLIRTEISDDRDVRARQMNENPGLWIRLNSNVRSLILSDVLPGAN
jgi:6-phosphogluconolactonase/glucosamine-6-phosphate isomerase/deaminase